MHFDKLFIIVTLMEKDSLGQKLLIKDKNKIYCYILEMKKKSFSPN